ncbi:hypothetical protein LINPERPRIM_LOCUS36544 [Linum perenne]
MCSSEESILVAATV